MKWTAGASAVSSVTLIKPPMQIASQRIIQDGRRVVRGPAGWNASWLWTSRSETAIVALRPDQPPLELQGISAAAFPDLGWNEKFGYDPTTSRSPLLRRMQQYASFVITEDIAITQIVGAVLLLGAPSSLYTVRLLLDIAFPLNNYNHLTDELRHASDAEHVIWRISGEREGYAIIPVRALLSPDPLTIITDIVCDEPPSPGSPFAVFGVVPSVVDDRLRYSEQAIGTATVRPVA